ncbi:MAG: hypothetical protein FWE53_01665 [Firmicutes bacterium]|nr:hypothetical protein [Bacillota bacterium]
MFLAILFLLAEIILILTIVFSVMFLPVSVTFTCLFFPLRKKNLKELSPKQKKMAGQSFDRFKNSKKGKKTPDLKIEQYLPILAKRGKKYLIVSIVFAVYLIAAIGLYAGVFQ